MRISVSLAVAATVLAFGAAARAQAPIEPYETAEPVAQPAPIRAGADSGAAADRPLQRLSGAAGLRLSGAGRRSAGDAVTAVVSARLLPVSAAGSGAGLLRPAAGWLLLLLPAAASAVRLRVSPDAAPGARQEAVGRRASLLDRRPRRLPHAQSAGRQRPGHARRRRLPAAAALGGTLGASRRRRASARRVLVGRVPARRVPVLAVAHVLPLPEQGRAPLQPVRRRAASASSPTASRSTTRTASR